MDTTRYRLHQFNEKEIDDIVFRYKKVLTEIVGDSIFAFRAGGWCIQPFDKISKALQKHNIWLDSTLYKNGLNLSSTHFIDFRNMPEKTSWKFCNNPLLEDKNGFFTELPISSMKMSPFFYWKFAFTKKFATFKHRIFGDGSPVGASKRDIFKMLTKASYSVVSCDGLKSSLLLKSYHNYLKLNQDNFVVIGHPKAVSLYSLAKIDELLNYLQKTNSHCVVFG